MCCCGGVFFVPMVFGDRWFVGECFCCGSGLFGIFWRCFVLWGLVCRGCVGGEFWRVSGGVSTIWWWGLGSGLGWLGVWAQVVGWCWLADVRFNVFHLSGL